MHIGFFVFPDFELLDLSGPLAAFGLAGRLADGAYRLSVVSATGGLIRDLNGATILTEPLEGKRFDSLLIAGGPAERACGADAATVAMLRAAADDARRIASICTGAFLLAATGLLDSRYATTHWRHAPRLQQLYPKVRVEADRIFVKHDHIWTSAGITAGIDLALAMIEEDLGIDVARSVARDLVVYHRRLGGQSQYSTLIELDPSSDRIRKTLDFARSHLNERLNVERLAEAAHLSPRQFSRAFQAETGQTPAKAIERLRAETARPRVEESAENLAVIARAVGFADPERMRQAFIRCFGQPPQALRRAARGQTDQDVSETS
ncbi:MAG TPA: DJ-1/PfpI family protein [Ensifer sp.]|jgi:transcriptional regulator GlxA family with amidase domain|uniref:GlxA family transcriptional regulator n=1 Tax=Ensifer sp. TaxID=1872086 RepID=UPI002E1345FB|nr:DJ-1/PfpI family protein [Ensifer sp.]